MTKRSLVFRRLMFKSTYSKKTRVVAGHCVVEYLCAELAVNGLLSLCKLESNLDKNHRKK